MAFTPLALFLVGFVVEFFVQYFFGCNSFDFSSTCVVGGVDVSGALGLIVGPAFVFSFIAIPWALIVLGIGTAVQYAMNSTQKVPLSTTQTAPVVQLKQASSKKGIFLMLGGLGSVFFLYVAQGFLSRFVLLDALGGFIFWGGILTAFSGLIILVRSSRN